MSPTPPARDTPENAVHFATTRWSVVLDAGRFDTADSEVAARARDALGELCEKAWYPLYAYLRRRGNDAEDARDLTQGFFADLIRRGDLRSVTPERGRFRAFLLSALKHYAANERDRAQAWKRGGRERVLSLDFERAEERYGFEPIDHRTPDDVFAANWARELLDDVMRTLADEYAGRGKVELFEKLSPCLGGTPDAQPYRQLAGELDATEGTVKVAVHRMRRRFRELLLRAVAQTVSDPSEAELEVRDLFDALGAEKS